MPLHSGLRSPSFPPNLTVDKDETSNSLQATSAIGRQPRTHSLGAVATSVRPSVGRPTDGGTSQQYGRPRNHTTRSFPSRPLPSPSMSPKSETPKLLSSFVLFSIMHQLLSRISRMNIVAVRVATNCDDLIRNDGTSLNRWHLAQSRPPRHLVTMIVMSWLSALSSPLRFQTTPLSSRIPPGPCPHQPR